MKTKETQSSGIGAVINTAFDVLPPAADSLESFGDDAGAKSVRDFVSKLQKAMDALKPTPAPKTREQQEQADDAALDEMLSRGR